MKKLAIRFSDNDFYNTMDAFFTILNKRGIHHYENLSKEKIVKLFNISAPGLYWLYQKGYESNLEMEEHMSKYIQIKIDNVYIDDEVDKYIQDHNGWDNCEFFVLDNGYFFVV